MYDKHRKFSIELRHTITVYGKAVYGLWACVYFHFTFLLSTGGKRGSDYRLSGVFKYFFLFIFYWYDSYLLLLLWFQSRKSCTDNIRWKRLFFDCPEVGDCVARSFCFFFSSSPSSLEDDPKELCHFLLFSSLFPAGGGGELTKTVPLPHERKSNSYDSFNKSNFYGGFFPLLYRFSCRFMSRLKFFRRNLRSPLTVFTDVAFNRRKKQVVGCG